MLGELWKTGKLGFGLYKSILIGDRPIIKSSISESTFNVMVALGTYLILWSN